MICVILGLLWGVIGAILGVIGGWAVGMYLLFMYSFVGVGFIDTDGFTGGALVLWSIIAGILIGGTVGFRHGFRLRSTA